MRIAYMLTSLGIGGAEKQVIALARRMAARGHDIALIVLRPRVPREWQTDLLVVRLDITSSPGTLAAGFMSARSFLRQFQPDLLHSHTYPANVMARTLRATASVRTVISTIHNVYEGGPLRTLTYTLTDPFAAHTTAVSQAVADRYIKIGAVPRRKCTVVTNGIDSDRFALGVTQGTRGREFMFAENRFVWLSAGRPVPAKDFDNLISAFRRVRAQQPETELWIAGELGEKRLVKINGQVVGTERYESEGIRWLGYREDMAATIASADAFVLSSAWEGMPLVIGEAMSMEKPVVATNVGGVGELLGDSGILVPSKNPQALADAMLRIMQMPEADRAAMGKAARARIIQHFDINAKADEWESLYTRILGDRQ